MLINIDYVTDYVVKTVIPHCCALASGNNVRVVEFGTKRWCLTFEAIHSVACIDHRNEYHYCCNLISNIKSHERT